MNIIENNCVGCPQGCAHCGRSHQSVVKCDANGCDHYAKYQMTDNCGNSEDYCEDCFKEFLVETFKDLFMDEQIEALKDYITVTKF